MSVLALVLVGVVEIKVEQPVDVVLMLFNELQDVLVEIFWAAPELNKVLEVLALLLVSLHNKCSLPPVVDEGDLIYDLLLEGFVEMCATDMQLQSIRQERPSRSLIRSSLDD